MTSELDLVQVKNEINKQLGDKETFNVLLTTTFKGLEPSTAKRAIMEGMIRGYTFKDFLEKNVYAIPFRDGYSLVTSIDYARKLGMRNGVVGKSAPTFEMVADARDNAVKLVSCTITIKRKVNDYVGEYSATVFFDEYYSGVKSGRSKPTLWDTKPRTMIAKVAEMHALRMACPEEMSQLYVEEEKQAEGTTPAIAIDITTQETKLRTAKTLKELEKAWVDVPPEAKKSLLPVKDEMKAILSTEVKQPLHEAA